MDITKLKGIGEKTAKKFKSCGIETVEQIFVIPPPKIAEMLGIDNDSAREIFRKATDLKYKDVNRFLTGKQANKEDDEIEKISTGTRALDRLFGGGLETGASTEIYGEFACGKTQFSHTMTVRVQLPKEKGGLGAKAIYLDTEGTFEPKRIVSIARALDMDENEALENITVVNVHNSADQYFILQEIEKLLVKEPEYKLLVIDSATGLFRQDYSGRAMLSERQKYLGEFLTQASNMASFHKIAVIWTNQVMVNPGVFYGDPIQVIGGTVMAHKSTYRVYFKKSGVFRIAKMIDSPKTGTIEVTFGLSESGVVDKEIAEELEKARKKAKADAKKAEKKEEETEEDD